MGRVYKDGKEQKTRAKPDIDPIDWDSLSAKLKRVTNDRNELLEPIDFIDLAMVLSNKNTHPQTGEPLPVPVAVRDFLADAFLKIAKGDDPTDVFRIVPKGRPKTWSTDDKVMACALVNRGIADGVEVGTACKDAAEIINDRFAHIKTEQQKAAAAWESPAWQGFFGREVSWTIIRDWYAAYSPAALGARLIDEK